MGFNEGIKHKKNPWFSAQFHPEAASDYLRIRNSCSTNL
ncbi:hypothetical protein NXW64_22595 [Bacteroides ovatus]|nr:hypothetical protein NXW64_22595 [Bacteroides ovatus]